MDIDRALTDPGFFVDNDPHPLWQQLRREEGKWGSYLQVNGKMFRDTMNSNIPRHAIWRPGLSWKQIGELDPNARHPMTTRGSDPEARLKDMDAMGVDQALLYPTWFAEGFHLIENPDVAYALARAYNNWIADFCGAGRGRLFAVTMLPLQHMDYALEELQRVRGIACFRAAFIRPMFIEGRYFTHPYYNPLWDELERTGLAAAVHALLRSILDDEPYWVPILSYRVAKPCADLHSERLEYVHQDGFFNPGIPFLNCWIPLVEMDAEVGGLAVAEVPTYLRKERRSWIH